MSQQMYRWTRAEPYSPSYGYAQGSNFIPNIPPVVEPKRSPNNPVFINYYPSGNTNNPQKIIAQVETVTREAVKSPDPMADPMKETRFNHHGDGQSRREDEFINKLRDETIKASADLNAIVEPKVLSTNLDQLQLSEQPRAGNGIVNDGWMEPTEPRKVAELMNRVSNWKGAKGGARPISSDGYNKLGYGIRRDNGMDNGWNKMPNVRQGMGYGGESRRTSAPRSEELSYYSSGNPVDDVYMTRRRDGIIDAGASGGYGIGRENGIDKKRWSKMAPNYVTPGYENMGYPMDTRQTATYGSGYNSGASGRLVEYDQVYGNPPAITSVITSADAVTKYKGTFVPLMTNGEQRKPHTPVKI